MKAQDFRIGNKVLRNGIYETIFSVEWHEVTEMYFAVLDNGCCFEDLENIKPIPLTEEILLKCGVVRVYGGTFALNDRYNDNSETCTDKFVLECFNFEENNQLKLHYTGDEGIKLSICIKYLHQLQNLYFALTGKELEINL